ncbi:MAG: CpaF family protein [Pirellulales bacterium]|nr:CpaF family protein [Pirellulales bacterium]
MPDPSFRDRLKEASADRLLQSSLSIPEDRIVENKPESGARIASGSVIGGSTEATSKRGVGRGEYLAIKGRLHRQLLDELEDVELLLGEETEVFDRIKDFVDDVLGSEELPLSETERANLPNDLLEETLGVGPLAPLLIDPAVTDILVNRFDEVFVERRGKLEETNVRFRDNDHLMRIIQRIAARVGRHVDDASPMLDARLPDGSRVNATIPPITLDGATMSIRRFGRRRMKRYELLERLMFSPAMDQFLTLAVRNRMNLLISGGTGSGKTTLLGAIAEAIPDHERIITIEDAAELLLDQRHVVRKETRPANIEGYGRVTQRELVINALRMRPDRIIVGEVRGGEALDMLQAMNTGHDGSLTTVHANSPRDAMARLETMVLMAGYELPSRAIREQIVSAIDLIVQVRRFEDGIRRVESVSELVGIEENTPQLQEIYRYKILRRDRELIQGRYEATGIVPKFVYRFGERGLPVPTELFAREDAASP